jgi:predicted component of type VI protein secretion system
MKRFFRNRERFALVLCGMLLMALLVACGGSSSSSSLASISPNLGKHVTATVSLSHVPFGTAQLNWNPGTHALTVRVSLVGLAPNSKHAASIFGGIAASR